MRLTREQSYTLLEKRGCYASEACDKCGQILGPVRFARRNDRGAWCSRECRDGAAAHAPGTCTYMIRRYVFWWWTCRDSNKPSGRSWARQLGVSHTWLQKLVREFQRNPDDMWRLQSAEGDPRLTDLGDAQECSREMRQRGELRPLRYRLPARGSDR